MTVECSTYVCGVLMAKVPPRYEIAMHPEFKVIYVNGAFGGLKADEGFMKFYLDIVKPGIKDGRKPGEMEMEKITREFQIEVRMTSATFLSISNWMTRHVKELQKKGVLKVEKKVPTAQEAYRI